MANLPATTSKDPSPRSRKLAQLLIKGWSPRAIADKLADGNPNKRRIILTQIGRLIHNDEQVQLAIAQAAAGLMTGDIPEITDAVGRRAIKGNIPAAKLAMEASGFYRPGVDHKHSGRIEIELKGVPRAPIVTDEDSGSIPDATVVEE